MMFRFGSIFLISLLFWGIFSNVQGFPPSKEIQDLEGAIERFEKSPAIIKNEIREKGETALTLLRRPWISKLRLEEAQELFRVSEEILQRDEKEEAVFLLARHAFLLNHPSLNTWLVKTRALSNETPWKVRGIYLEALHHYREKELEKADEIFTQLEKEFRDSEVRAYSTLGRARLAFDRGDYKEAQDIFKDVPPGSKAYKYSLDEGAWAHVRTRDYDQATTSISLLFMLFPRSSLLPNAGFLTGRIYEDRTVFPDRESDALARLATRFGFEEESIDHAVTAFRNHEEEILFEFDPTLKPVAARAIIPPLLRTPLKKNLLIRSSIRALREIESEKKELQAGENSLRAMDFALSGEYGTSRQAVIFIEWANSLERTLLAVPRKRYLGLENLILKTESIEKELRKFLKDLHIQENKLIDIEAHLGINWRLLGGSREGNAFEIKKQVREQLQEKAQIRFEIERLISLNSALNMRVRRQSADVESKNLVSFRSELHGDESIFSKLDQLRDRTRKKDKKDLASLRRLLVRTRESLRVDIGILEKNEALLLKQTRPEIRRVLLETAGKLHSTLGKYRWSIAEAHYADLKRIEDKIREHQESSEKENQLLDDRFQFLERVGNPRSTLVRIPEEASYNVAASLETDSELFRKSSDLFVRTIQKRLKEKGLEDRERYESFSRRRYIDLVNEREMEREETLLVHQDLVDRHPRDPRTPYALYRLAQLHFDRAERLAGKLTTKSSPERTGYGDYNLVIKPLHTIEENFPEFPHRDSALYLLGYAYHQTGKPDSSVAAFKRLVREFPDSKLIPEVQLRIGEYYFSRREFEKARPHYQAVLARGFNFFYDKALYKLAWSSYLTGRYDSAISYFLILLDYSQELPKEQKEAFVEFQEEAEEYVAFSLYRSGGYSSAKRIFSKVGWKSYAFPIIRRMSLISEDRGREKSALEGYSLLLEKFPTEEKLPEVLRRRIEILENLDRAKSARGEKESALEILEEDSTWTKSNEENLEALKAATGLKREILYSLATEYDQEGTRRKNRSFSRKASTLYSEIVESYASSEEAYNSSFRLGEIAFQEESFSEAISHYDRVVRNGSFGHHFSDSLFGIVVSRERVLQSTPSGKKGKDQEQLVNAIANFQRRAPHDPRSPEVLYRLGSVFEEDGKSIKASDAYMDVFRLHPETDYGKKGALAAVNALAKGEKWAEAANLSRKIRKDHGTLEADTLKELVVLEEGAKFKSALQLEKENQSKEAIHAYLDFQKEFPRSAFAPTALFNAFVVGKRSEQFIEASQALEILLGEYPKAPESSSARFEKAMLLEKLYRFEEASELYDRVSRNAKDTKVRDIATLRLSKLILASPNEKKSDAIFFENRKLRSEIQSEIFFQSARSYARKGDFEKSEALYRQLAFGGRFLSFHRAMAACRLSERYWSRGKTQEALRWERKAKRLSSPLKGDEKAIFDLAWSEMEVRRIANDTRFIRSLKIEVGSMNRLMRSFKSKATRIAQLESRVISHVKRGHLHTGAEALFELGRTLFEFSSELELLAPPPGTSEENQANFKKSITELRTPLLSKAKEALNQSLKIHQQERLPAPYLPELQNLFRSIKSQPTQETVRISHWISPLFPRAPAFRELEIETSETIENEKSKNRSKEAGFVQKGLQEVKDIWNEKERSKAEEFFNKALVENPRSAPALFNRAITKIFDGEPDAAKQTLRLGIFGDNSPERLILAALLSWWNFDGPRLERRMKSLMEKNEQPSWVREGLVVAYLLQGKLDSALEEAQKHLENSPKSLDAHRLLAHVYQVQGKRETARFILKRSLERDPENPLLQIGLARALSSRENFHKATLTRKAEKHLRHPLVQGNWAHLAFLSGLEETACGEWDKTSELVGDRHPDLRSNLKLCRPSKKGSSKP